MTKKNYLSSNFTKKLLLSIIFGLILVISCNKNDVKIAKVKMKNKIYNLEIADNNELRSKGLMFRSKLSKKTGMIFIYSYGDYRNFYMKNTRIPLDIAFIDHNLKVINIEQMEPLDESLVPSKGLAMYAIEMNKGFFDSIDLKAGDSIEIISSIKYPNDN